MPSDVAISVKNLTKTYRLFSHPGDRVKQFLTLGMKQYHQEFIALKDVSFDIKKGETVGIIGRNGSGKSTLLQLICGILKPTSGMVQVNGRVSALLELGAGFNPEFTGRENVYFHGALMGFTKAAMDACFDDIAAFADIGEFIDQPVRTYSSGMFVRLAFSVAVSISPDILVVDEALAVGDARFQAKCLRRIQEMRDCGGTVLLVTHAADQIARLCDHALLIDQGYLVESGTPKEVLNSYFSAMIRSPEREAIPAFKVNTSHLFNSRPGYNPGEYRFGNGIAEIIDFQFQPNSGKHNLSLQFDSIQRVAFKFQVAFHQPVSHVTFAIAISTLDGMNLFGINSRDLLDQISLPSFNAGDIAEASFSLSLCLAKGDYLVSLSVSEDVSGYLEPLDRRYDAIYISIANPVDQRGFVNLDPKFSISALFDSGTLL